MFVFQVGPSIATSLPPPVLCSHQLVAAIVSSLVPLSPTTMSSPTISNCGLSFCSVFARFTTASRRSSSALIPVLQAIVQASPAFPPLQSASGGLLKIMETMEVCRFFSQSCDIVLATHFSTQKAAQNSEDVAELTTVFSNLVTMLHGPLQNVEACTPALRQRIETLSRSLHLFPRSCVSANSDFRAGHAARSSISQRTCNRSNANGGSSAFSSQTGMLVR